MCARPQITSPWHEGYSAFRFKRKFGFSLYFERKNNRKILRLLLRLEILEFWHYRFNRKGGNYHA